MAEEGPEIILTGSGNIEGILLPLAAADLSPVIKENLGNRNSRVTKVHVGNYHPNIVHVVSEYLLKQVQADDEKKRNRIKRTFLSAEARSMRLDLLFDAILAAHDLKIQGLEDLIAERIAGMIKNKSVEWVREAFDIEGNGGIEEAEVEDFKALHPSVFTGLDQDEPSTSRNKPGAGSPTSSFSVYS